MFILRNTKLKKNQNFITKQSEVAWQRSQFLPLPFVVSKDDKLLEINRTSIIDSASKISSIYGPVILYAEKKTEFGWIMTTLTQERFEQLKKSK